MAKLEGKKYPEQIAHLRENYGFSQAHANALVMYSRGSQSSKRYETPAQYFKTLDPKQATKVRAIFKAITSKFSGEFFITSMVFFPIEPVEPKMEIFFFDFIILAFDFLDFDFRTGS